MTERERLKELLLSSDPIKERDLDDDYGDGELDEIVDHLLSNGVIVPPCPITHDSLFAIVDLYNRKKIVGQTIAKYDIDCIIIGF